MDKDFPLVCICIPTYNAASTIRETLESILAQTYPNLVVHISDNASTDRTIEIVASMADSRVRIHQHEVNVGGEGNFNRCIELAVGKYTAIFHSDDIYEQDMVAKQVLFLEANLEAAAVFTEASKIDEHGRMFGHLNLPERVKSEDCLYNFSTIFKAILLYSNFLICPSALVRTDIYKNEIKFWRGEAFGTSSDLDVWFRILDKHLIGILPEQLMRYRISTSQHSEKLRSRVSRSDFFRVIDHYLIQNKVREFVSSNDLLNYRRLERTDRIVRATNLYLLGDEQGSNALCFDILSFDTFSAAISNRRDFITLTIGLTLKVFVLCHLSVFGKPFLSKLKQFARK